MIDTAFLSRYGSTPAETAEHLRTALADFETALTQCESRWFVPIREHLGAGEPSRYQGLWSPAQQAEHVLKANIAFSKVMHLLNGTRELPEIPREFGPMHEGRRIAPENLEPGEGLPWAQLEPQWRETNARLLTVVEAIDPASSRTFWHRYLGELNAFGWARMACGHVRDHRRQLGVS
ncbi:DinB family protein [Deinococcus peraridilitoris]|uniref:DinB-like domain-containing protein n=1 Tax=Deinococcus peraridilitoris (strain DSM 19664 / LMG 22246 / CIP 109416 / KR-200) TaxID=937777 RepID=L0A324_DEIPD|nr:DinB family protein [Deinococcus peraridilitoris]AFZ68293.1 hypothetical protein Deipe_2830 [Deinococcus peraridilitoris DSM 19664]